MIEPDPKVLSVMTAVRVTAAARPKSIIEVVMRIVDALSTDCGWPKDREAGREFIPLIGAALDLYLAPPQPGSPPARSIQ